MVISKELLEHAIKLHGHLGPFLVLGIRMSLRAERILGEKPERCEVETLNRKPFLCVLDGIKAVAGSKTVTVGEGNGLSARFSKANNEEVVIRVRKALVGKYSSGSWEKNEEYANEVIQSDDAQLFD